MTVREVEMKGVLHAQGMGCGATYTEDFKWTLEILTAAELNNHGYLIDLNRLEEFVAKLRFELGSSGETMSERLAQVVGEWLTAHAGNLKDSGFHLVAKVSPEDQLVGEERTFRCFRKMEGRQETSATLLVHAAALREDHGRLKAAAARAAAAAAGKTPERKL